MDIIKAYGAEAKKHKLPSFKELDKEFDISLLEPTPNFLMYIRKRIVERLEFALEILEKILQPDTNSLADMMEIKTFNEEEKESILKLFKNLMVLHRTSYEIDLDDNKSEAEYIKLASKDWKEYKKELVPIVKKLKENWKTETEEKSKLSYLG